MKFDRVIKLDLRLIEPFPGVNYRGNLEISNLRVAFNVVKSQSYSTNQANIRVYNLSADKRNQIANVGDEIRLSAGYRLETGPELIFLGNTTQVTHIFEQPDIISVFEVSDGELSVNRITLSLSFTAKTLVKDVLKKIADELQLNIVTSQEVSEIEDKVYNYASAFLGTAKAALDTVCQNLELDWSVQNGNLVIVKKGSTTLKPPVEINADTGMIGVPQRLTDKRLGDYSERIPVGWRVQSLLRSDILPKDRIRLRSSRVDIDGVFEVLTITHNGDNFGPLFTSTMEVVEI